MLWHQEPVGENEATVAPNRPGAVATGELAATGERESALLRVGWPSAGCSSEGGFYRELFLASSKCKKTIQKIKIFYVSYVTLNVCINMLHICNHVKFVQTTVIPAAGACGRRGSEPLLHLLFPDDYEFAHLHD